MTIEIAADAAPAGYAVIRELGHGRLGRVLLCRTEPGPGAESAPAGGAAAGDEQVAVKVLDVRPEDERARLRLEAELRAVAAAGTHPAAAAITRVWADDGVGVCLAQEYCSKGSAQSALATLGRMDPTDVAAGGVRIATALARSHRNGVLHGDIRPANILLDADGNWRLADGGVANAVRRATPGAGALHDPRYAARELFGWEEPGPPADVFALGATLFALLAGSPPGADAARRGPAALYAALLAGPAPLPAGVPERLAGLVLRMLAVDPADRPTLAEVDQVLRAQVPTDRRSALPDPEPPPPVLAPPRPAVRIAVTEPEVVARAGRRRTVLIASAIAVVFLAGAGGALAVAGGDDEPSGPPAAKPAPPGAQFAPDAAYKVEGLTADLNDARALVATWKPPADTTGVEGFIVAAKTNTGQQKVAVELPASARQHEFGPEVSVADCVHVSTRVTLGQQSRVVETRRHCPAAGAVGETLYDVGSAVSQLTDANRDAAAAEAAKKKAAQQEAAKKKAAEQKGKKKPAEKQPAGG